MRFLNEGYLKALKHVTDAATPGPWKVGLEIDGPLAGCPVVVRTDPLDASRGLRVVTVDTTRPHVRGDQDKAAVANVAFIAAARDAVPRLLAENRYLRNLLTLSTAEEGGGDVQPE
jgi:hypothetical protein